jgi:PST family polysaccharide transporter
MAALAPELIRLFFGAKWLPSIPVIQILAILGLSKSIYYFNASVILAMGKPFWKLMLNLSNAIANVIAFSLAVKGGIVAVAAACVISFYLTAPIELVLVQKLIPINIITYIRQFVSSLIGSIVMVGAIMATKYVLNDFLNLYATLAICVLLGSAVYVLVILLIAPSLTRQTIDLVKSAIPLKNH